MNLDQIIKLFEDIEKGNEGQLLGYHLHFGVNQASRLIWFNHWKESNNKFSDFLKALKNHDPIEKSNTETHPPQTQHSNPDPYVVQ